ncbi:MAG: hypothetical protein M0Z95_20100 [Actinomycetota bacterium]|jgi:hypothetical protein|nr:hypothetical protein [Actinomycetota bacterium]
MPRRHFDEEGQGIITTIVALMAMILLGVILVTTVSSYASDTLTATERSNAAAVASRILQTETVNQCGAAVGIESTAAAATLASVCPDGLGDFSRSTQSAGFTYWVDFFSSWVPSTGLVSTANCADYASDTPSAILETVFVSWRGSGGVYQQQGYTSIEPVPTVVLSYASDAYSAILTPGGGTLTTPSGATIQRSGMSESALASYVSALNQAASGSTPPAVNPGGCAWFPYLLPGSWTTTNSSGVSNTVVIPPVGGTVSG